jgi:hypothetical protein
LLLPVFPVERERDGAKQNDERRQALLPVDDIDDMKFISSERLCSLPKAHNRGHEMTLTGPFRVHAADVSEQIFSLVARPAVSALVFGYAEQPAVEQFREG